MRHDGRFWRRAAAACSGCSRYVACSGGGAAARDGEEHRPLHGGMSRRRAPSEVGSARNGACSICMRLGKFGAALGLADQGASRHCTGHGDIQKRGLREGRELVRAPLASGQRLRQLSRSSSPPSGDDDGRHAIAADIVRARHSLMIYRRRAAAAMPASADRRRPASRRG